MITGKTFTVKVIDFSNLLKNFRSPLTSTVPGHQALVPSCSLSAVIDWHRIDLDRFLKKPSEVRKFTERPHNSAA